MVSSCLSQSHHVKQQPRHCSARKPFREWQNLATWATTINHSITSHSDTMNGSPIIDWFLWIPMMSNFIIPLEEERMSWPYANQGPARDIGRSSNDPICKKTSSAMRATAWPCETSSPTSINLMTGWKDINDSAASNLTWWALVDVDWTAIMMS